MEWVQVLTWICSREHFSSYLPHPGKAADHEDGIGERHCQLWKPHPKLG